MEPQAFLTYCLFRSFFDSLNPLWVLKAISSCSSIECPGSPAKVTELEWVSKFRCQDLTTQARVLFVTLSSVICPVIFLLVFQDWFIFGKPICWSITKFRQAKKLELNFVIVYDSLRQFLRNWSQFWKVSTVCRIQKLESCRMKETFSLIATTKSYPHCRV